MKFKLSNIIEKGKGDSIAFQINFKNILYEIQVSCIDEI